MQIQELLQVYAQLHAGRNRDLKYQSFYDLIAAYGRKFTPIPRPKNVRQGVPRHCYYNATQIARKGRHLYCEGFYISNEIGFPVSHAWLMDESGNAIDPTLDYKPETQQQYFGVALAFDFVKWHQSISKEAAILESDYIHHYKLLREGFPPAAVTNASDLDTLIQQATDQGVLYAAHPTPDGNVSIRQTKTEIPQVMRPANALVHLLKTTARIAT